MANATRTIPDGYYTITPHLMLDDAAKSIEWYKKALGAEELSRFSGPDGKVMHAELKIGNSRFMVGEVMEGMKGPKGFGGSPTSLWLYVDESDRVFNKAVSSGAKVHMPMANQFWGDHAGAFTDPAGYIWWVATHVEDLTPEETQRRAAESFKQPAHH
jgi:PhnB protein